MKKFLITAVAAAMTFTAGSVSAEDLRIGVEGAYPPFSSIDTNGNVVGFDIDIANALCDEMKANCTMVVQDWDGIIPALNAKKYHAIIASMSITDERKKKVDFSEKYYNSPARFLRKKGSGVEITAEGMKGKSVGVQRGTIHDVFITAEFPDTEIKRYGTQDEAYLDVAAGRVDLLIADSIAMDDGFVKTPAGKDFELFGPSYNDPKYFGVGAGIAVRKTDTELRDRFSAAIKAIRANGVYKAINDKYFDTDIY